MEYAIVDVIVVFKMMLKVRVSFGKRTTLAANVIEPAGSFGSRAFSTYQACGWRISAD
jgi:hypothetical protein